MRFRSILFISLAACAVSRGQIPEKINYQGRLLQGTNLANGNVALVLRLYNVPSGGSILYEDSNTVAVSDGLYATRLGDGTTSGTLTNALTNDTVYLETVVNGTTLSPREQLLAVPFALRALDSGLKGYAENGAFDQRPVASGSNAVAHGFSALASGRNASIGGGYSNTASALGTTVAGGTLNAASASQASALGGINNQAGGLFSTVAGGANNVAYGNAGTVGGGQENVASNHYATVGGGFDNAATGENAVVSGGTGNRAMNQNATVAGGTDNKAEGSESTVAGGTGNRAVGFATFVGGGSDHIANGAGSTIGGGYQNETYKNDSTVAGGNSNVASNFYAAVGGGINNRASGIGSAIPGGEGNTAAGEGSVAMGISAHADHDGTFMWSDGSGGDFYSGANNQFLIHTENGVGINTTNARSALNVNGLATIGVTTSFMSMGYARVASSYTGAVVLFTHPYTNFLLRWYGNLRKLEVENTTGNSVDCMVKLHLTKSSNAFDSQGNINLVAPGETISLTNSLAWCGWDVTVTMCCDTNGPGFIFSGNAADRWIDGLVTYWK